MPIKSIANVDLYQCPLNVTPSTASDQFTVGDLHGNAMKLIHFLVMEGVLVVENELYDALVEIYKKNELSKADLDLWNLILNGMTVNPVARVRLIGDELADRGQNDYLTLKVLEMLRVKGVPVEILISNHSFEFIEDYETKMDFTCERLGQGQAHSLYALGGLIDSGLITKEEVRELVGSVYKPTLRALTYTLSEDEQTITLFTHAPCDVKIVQALAKQLNVEYNDDSAVALAETIDRINESFQGHVKAGEVHKLRGDSDEEIEFASFNRAIDLTGSPFIYLIWNIHYFQPEVDKGANRENLHKDFHVNFVHGHNPDGVSNEYIANLDGLLGKLNRNARGEVINSEHERFGEYRILRDDIETPEPLLEMQPPGDAPELAGQAQLQIPDDLIASVNAMKSYGKSLVGNGLTYEGAVAMALASNLTKMIEDCAAGKGNQEIRYFKMTFTQLLHSQDAIMNKHRAAWKPILLNIAIALTGIGLLVLAGKLIQSKVSTGQCTFFAANTKRQQQVNAIERQIKKL